MALIKLFETSQGIKPAIIIYRNKPTQLFIQFIEEGMAVNDFTVDDVLLINNDLYSVFDFEKNVNKEPTNAQRQAFEIARNWLLNQVL